MDFNQIPNQSQATSSPTLPLDTNPQMVNIHLNYQQPQQPANPDSQPPSQSIPNPSITDQLSVEFNQLSSNINNQREIMQDFLVAQVDIYCYYAFVVSSTFVKK